MSEFDIREKRSRILTSINTYISYIWSVQWSHQGKSNFRMLKTQAVTKFMSCCLDKL